MPELRQTEKPEVAISGPFAGILADIPPDLVGDSNGFSDCLNLILREGMATTKPSVNAEPAVPAPAEPVEGVPDFFNANGSRISAIITPSRLFKWTGSTWGQITGALTGSSGELFTWTVVGNKLCFSQGVDKVQLWDGISAGFAVASVNAVPGFYLYELNGHLVVCNTNDGGTPHTQRVWWTGIGDPTDWTSFNAGSFDLNNDLGPINGAVKIFQTGFLFQQWGITQMIPTGIGTSPWLFPPFTRSRGLIAPYSLASGGDFVCFVSKENVYMFDGSSFTPIGDFPMQGTRMRMGARTRIFGDLRNSNLNAVFGYVSDSVGGNDFNAYYLSIPGVAVWVYNIDEQNWTRWTYANGVPNIIGRFNWQNAIRIQDLLGTIAQQTWTPATLGNNPLDSLLFGFGQTEIDRVDLFGYDTQKWTIDINNAIFGDRRHDKTVGQFRIVYNDLGSAFQLSVKITNEKGIVAGPVTTNVPTKGGGVQTVIVPIRSTGMYKNIHLESTSPVQLLELAPIYDTGGESKNGING